MCTLPFPVKKGLFPFFLLFLIYPFPVFSEPGPETEGLSIQSEQMTYENQKQKAVFKGSVKIIKDDVTIHADIAEIVFSGPSTLPSGEGELPNLGTDFSTGGGREISQIEISGNVEIIQGLRKSSSEKAVYEKEREIVVLTGNPVIREAGNEVRGKKVTLFLKENRSEVEESRVVIQPKGGKP